MMTDPEIQTSLLRQQIYKRGGAALLVLTGSLVLDTHLLPMATAVKKVLQVQFGTAELLVAGIAVLPIIAMLILLLLMIKAGLGIRASKRA